MTQRLCDPLPYTVEFEGKTLDINPYFDNVLDVLSVFDDTGRTEEEKVMYAYAVLVRRKSSDIAYQGRVIQHIAETILFPDKQEKKHNERSFDFIQDAPYIYAAYRQAYGIDLFAEQGRLHWWAFLYLFKGLPENTRMMEIIKIRTQPMPKPTKHNAEYRQALSRAKLQVALKVPQAERERRTRESMEAFAEALMKMAQA